MKKYIIENEYQKITLLNYGATIYLWEAFSDRRNIVISNLDLKDYTRPKTGFLSNTIGRVANRIKNGIFTLNDKTYNLEINFPGAHGHGGNDGFFQRKFSVEEHTKTKIVFKHEAKHLESGYPGKVDVLVTYELNNNEMLMTYNAVAYDDTILNLTNHAYFNLSAENNILNHKIIGDTYKILETDKELNPTGKTLDYQDDIYDLTKEKVLKEVVLSKQALMKADGLDHFFMFNENKEIELIYNNKSLKIETSYPGLQIYTMQNKITQPLLNRKYEKYLGIAFECQFEPDAINQPNFSSIILRKGEKYDQFIKYTIKES